MPSPSAIPEEFLNSVIHPLYSHSCSTRTFRNILTIIENLSHLSSSSVPVISSGIASPSLVKSPANSSHLAAAATGNDQSSTESIVSSRMQFLIQLFKASDWLCSSCSSDLENLLNGIKKHSKFIEPSSPGSPNSADPRSPTDSKKPAKMLKMVDEIEIQKLTLSKFSPGDSNQAKLLRVLKTIDYIYTKRKLISDNLSAKNQASIGSNRGESSASQRPSYSTALARSPTASVSPTPSESELILASGSVEETRNLLMTMEADNLLQKLSQDHWHKLWEKLQQCLVLIDESQNMGFVATVLLPIIECLMIVSKYWLLAAKVIDGRKASFLRSSPVKSSSNLSGLSDNETSSSRLEPPLLTSLPDSLVNEQANVFYSFTDKNRGILNNLVKSNPKLLRGSFSLMIHNPNALDFDSKRTYFNQQLHKKPPASTLSNPSQTINISVRRQYIFQDSYYQLQGKTGPALRYGKLNVKFADEEGADYGGLTREWYEELAKQIFNPNYALWKTSTDKTGVTYQPNPTSWVNPSHLLYFKFIGRVIGKAIYDGRLLDCYFTRPVYKHILNKKVDLTDMEAVDPEYHKSLVWILENPINDIIDLTFSTEIEEFGQQKEVDLIPNGRNVAVCDDNKHEYVDLIVENKLTNAIKSQLDAFLEGFYEIIPLDLVSIFTEKELELLISGVPDIDIDDWKNNTEYRGYNAASTQVQWFWRAIRSFDQEQRAKLLQFATGTSKVPLEGFVELKGVGGKQKFQIHKDFGSVDRLPSAHTCFNQIDLPVYETYEQQKERLLKAITEGATGFGME